MTPPNIVVATKNINTDHTSESVSTKNVALDFTGKRLVDRPYDDKQLKEMFKRQDANGDGRLSREELKNAFASFGSFAPGWRAFRALRHADKNRNDYVDEDELDYVVKYAAKRGYKIK
ncbi:Parvalbumin [Parasponia andersonii]|uniref:Parvalbumin n=1 Tax=Parasponia andersonii TaxID=3476 RepID=A0A2P5B0S2_PARAD|nr:Parvalbumin [Parasponia andersonii]